ncbi:helix-turn-helix domain-containing protein [Dactylosporangium sp. CA-052675]|uniref:helix-turn-helix domain-containing protein n=1 Tax=Dactylosporangium sp. CA-052675 TaxID=3239927 RepID=UPI003D91E6C7
MSSQHSPAGVHRGSAYARRHLRAALRRHRELLGPAWTQREIGDRLGWSPAKLLRIEQGHVRVSQTDLEALVRLYGIDDPDEVELLMAWQRAGRKTGSLIGRHRHLLSKTALEFYEEEEAASRLLDYEPLLIPGHLQTERYARVVHERLGGARAEPDDETGSPRPSVEDRITIMKARQQYLEPEHNLQGHFVLGAAALRLRVGNEDGGDPAGEVMAEQLTHLREMNARHDNVTIQVVPDSAGLFNRYMRFPFVILEFDDGDRLSLLEMPPDGTLIRHGERHIADLADAFEAISALASAPADFDAIAAAALAALGS